MSIVRTINQNILLLCDTSSIANKDQQRFIDMVYGGVYGLKGNYPNIMKDFTDEQRLQMGKSFIEDTKIHRKNAPMFTDKMPNNFRHIGLIHLILPNAKIIDARRYPLDCCFSMFKQLFAQGQEFTYGLNEAGSYYDSYIKLMNHWDRVLPGKILRVNNEDVINDLEGQVRKILNFINIPFEENCISILRVFRFLRMTRMLKVL